jgi:alpha-mannosidase
VAWLKTRDEYLQIGYKLIMEVLHAMEGTKEYRYVLDQTFLIQSFVEKYPEQSNILRQMVDEKHLEIVGGMYVMPDVNMIGGESLIRQVLEGKRYCEKKFGIDIRVGWMIDTFGHHPQIPQIMKKCGFDYYVFARVMDKNDPSAFVWKGIDGSTIRAEWLPFHYCLLWPLPETQFEFNRFVNEKVNKMLVHSSGEHILGLNGIDFASPQTHVPALAANYNKTNPGNKLIMSTPSEYYRSTDGDKLTVIEKDLNAIYQGCYSARIRVKQYNRRLENEIIAAEKWHAINSLLGGAGETERLDTAWEKIMINQFHDIICGCHVDEVYNEVLSEYKIAESVITDSLEDSLAGITSRIKVRKDGIPVVVYNPLSWKRTDVAEVEIGISEQGVYDLHMADSKGREVPIQFIEEERYKNDGGLKKAKIIFIAEDVPPVGYKTYYVVHGPGEGGKTSLNSLGYVDELGVQQDVHEATIENEFYRLKFNSWTGLITSIYDKICSLEVIDRENPVGNIIAREIDRGDLWEYNGPCRGGATTPTKRLFPFPARWEADFSDRYGAQGKAWHGNVFAQFELSGVFGNSKRSTKVRVYNKVQRIEMETGITNNEEWVRYRVAMPVNIKDGRITYEIPFGAIERPHGEYPAQNWVDYSDGKRGVGLLNQGLPGNNVVDNVMMLSLLKCTSLREAMAGMVSGVNSDTAFEKGIQHTFRYALVPHEGDWRKARMYKSGWEFNCPLVVRKHTGDAGYLPSELSFLEIDGDNVILSCFKGNRDALILRVYESEGRNTAVRIRLFRDIETATESNLIEQSLPEGTAVLQVRKNTIGFEIKPFEIKTLKIKLKGETKYDAQKSG